MSKGENYERRAARLLVRSGLQIVARNFRARTGEVDIIALDGPVLVFVEVRARSNRAFSSAAASVDHRKQRKLYRTAQSFLQRHPQWRDSACRFDVVAFEPRQSATDLTPNWIRGAFTG
ncbi:MAG: YraN family protein [Halioglobus sp.]|nr:YraN family protein [Halioglobus sp.]